MDTLNAFLINSCRAATCVFVLLLSACGGGGGASAPANMATAAAAPAPVGTDVAAQPASGGASPVVVPSPPDMSIAPPPGTVVTPPAPDMSASVATAGTMTSATSDTPATTVTLGAPASADLPDGATACQPSICPAFIANGSVTNTQGTDNPTAAHAYLLPASGAVGGAYPDLGKLPTMVFPVAAVTVTEAPN